MTHPSPHRRSPGTFRLLLLILVALGTPRGGLAEPPGGVMLFERKIRPLLLDHCASCHGAEKQKGSLRLDSVDAILAGGESGPIFVPGDPAGSRLIQAVRHTDEHLKMPPKKKLAEREIEDLTAWVQLGAPMPAGTRTPASTSKPAAQSAAPHWAFEPVRRPALPGSPHRSSPENPIDRFIQAALAERGLAPSPEASPRELIRRVSFDLTGLPPTPEETRAFEADPSLAAYGRLVDRLLASPRYGERWGRHWLDLVRFAQSNGYERDGEKPLAWRYRDYVIRAFNEDKPYDRFILEQIAGDELPDGSTDAVVATGFQHLGVWDDEPDDKRMAEFDSLDDILNATGAAFLGVTIGCARCHDHKFDPISQAEYYSMLAYFRGVRHYANPPFNLDSPGFAPLLPAGAVRGLDAEHRARKTARARRLAAARNDEERKRIEAEQPPEAAVPVTEWALAVREVGATPIATRVLIRGNPATEGREVNPGVPQALQGGAVPGTITAPAEGTSSGRRLAFAGWLANPANPLTARVLVNRVWHHHFGQGLVKTTTDFGRAGSPPSHPELIDWLASEFVRSGWSVKQLHRQILMSRTYRQSSRIRNEAAESLDPGNTLVWRQNLRRLEAESLRDTLLSISGELNLSAGGRGFFPHVSGEVLAGQSRPGLDWEISSDAELSRRSVYTYIRRTMLVPILDTLDYSNTTSPLGERPVTTVAPQALLLMNEESMQRQAKALARRLRRDAGDAPADQIRAAYRLATSREPSTNELLIASRFLGQAEADFTRRRDRLFFRPGVAEALSSGYFEKLSPSQFLSTPAPGWSVHRGFWEKDYESIRGMDPMRAPFATKNGEISAEGGARLVLTLQRSATTASLLMQARAQGDQLIGYALVLDPTKQRLEIRRHDPLVTVLASTPCPLPAATPLNLELGWRQGRVRASLGGTPVVEVVDPAPLKGAGQFGVSVWGGGVSLDGLELARRAGAGGGEDQGWVRVGGDGGEPRERALELFSLLVLNLSEVVYVD